MKRHMRGLYLAWLLDSRAIAARRTVREILRTLMFRKRTVDVFLQLDDPYSYLLSHYLAVIREQYAKITFRYYLGQSLRGDYMPEPGLAAEYAVYDCKELARELGVPFLDVGNTPVVEYRRSLLDFLAEEHDEEDFPDTFTRALALYWRGDSEGVQRMLGRVQPERAETSVLVGRNQLLLRKMGHYSCATLHYQGEWYAGTDRLPYFVDRLDGWKLKRFDEAVTALASLRQAQKLSLPATRPSRAAALPPFELFYSFRSPYSYLSLERVFRIADAFGLRLDVRPVLPMVMRGMKVPRAKLRYIVQDANREARKHGVAFGRIADSLGRGAERCIAAFYYAKGEGRERDFLLEAGKAIFADAIDVATDDGMAQVAERAGLFWPDLKKSLADDSWRDNEAANRQAFAEAGL